MKQKILVNHRCNSYPQPFSIQFDPNMATLSALNIGPGYRLLQLHDDGNIATSLHYLDVNL